MPMMHLPNFPASHAQFSGDESESSSPAAHGRQKDARGAGVGSLTRGLLRSFAPIEWLVAATLDVTARENAGHVVQDVGSRVVVVAVITDQAGLDDVDLFLSVLVDYA
jgi:hypothetical protein